MDSISSPTHSTDVTRPRTLAAISLALIALAGCGDGGANPNAGTGTGTASLSTLAPIMATSSTADTLVSGVSAPSSASSDSASIEEASSSDPCEIVPEETEGPYPADGSSASNSPPAGHAVYVWHCMSEGTYSVCSTQSLPEIGERFSRRDHTTVFEAVRKISAKRQQLTELDQQPRVLEQALKG